MKIIAHLISFLFHPVLVPTYAVLFVIWCNPFKFGYVFKDGHLFTADALFITRTAVLYSILYPLFTLSLMKGLGFVDSYQVKTREERILIYISTIFYFGWTFFVFYQSSYHEIMSDIMLGSTIALSAALVFTALYHKISAHAIGMGGLLAIIFYASSVSVYDISSYIMLAIFLAGIVGTARLLLKAHTPEEVYMGYVVGVASQVAAFLV